MTKLGRPSVWEQHRDDWVRLFEEGQSRGQIARQYGTSVQTVTRQLDAAGVDLNVDRLGDTPRPHTAAEQAAINAKISESRKGKGTGPRVEREERTCQNPECGQSYTYIPGRTGERFCSRSCRNTYRVGMNRQQAQEEYETDPRRCPCGEAIPYEYRHTRQYCSPEHRKQYQAKRAKDPTRSTLITCQNPTCGKQVERYKGYGNGALKFCSNECARTHTKTRRFYAVEDFDIVFESSYEALFWGLCAFRKLPVERFDRENGIAWREGGWYAPDFYLPRMELAVEVKGVEDGDDPEKWTAFRERYRLAVLGREELDVLCKTHDFVGVLGRIATITKP